MEWEEVPPIALKCLQRPQKEGGIDLLDLEAWSLAIEITWLKKYLDTTKPRPTWAFTTDTLLNCIKPDGVQCLNNVNIFLTSLSPPTQTCQSHTTHK